jgi:hypothetical protein
VKSKKDVTKFYHAPRISHNRTGFYMLELSGVDSLNQNSIGECEMATIAAWCTALFFLWWGLSAFVPALATDTFRKVGAVLALIVGIVGVLVLLGMG